MYIVHTVILALFATYVFPLVLSKRRLHFIVLAAAIFLVYCIWYVYSFIDEYQLIRALGNFLLGLLGGIAAYIYYKKKGVYDSIA